MLHAVAKYHTEELFDLSYWLVMKDESTLHVTVTHYFINFVEGLHISTSYRVLITHEYLITIDWLTLVVALSMLATLYIETALNMRDLSGQ